MAGKILVSLAFGAGKLSYQKKRGYRIASVLVSLLLLLLVLLGLADIPELDVKSPGINFPDDSRDRNFFHISSFIDR